MLFDALSEAVVNIIPPRLPFVGNGLDAIEIGVTRRLYVSVGTYLWRNIDLRPYFRVTLTDPVMLVAYDASIKMYLPVKWRVNL